MPSDERRYEPRRWLHASFWTYVLIVVLLAGAAASLLVYDRVISVGVSVQNPPIPE